MFREHLSLVYLITRVIYIVQYVIFIMKVKF